MRGFVGVQFGCLQALLGLFVVLVVGSFLLSTCAAHGGHF